MRYFSSLLLIGSALGCVLPAFADPTTSDQPPRSVARSKMATAPKTDPCSTLSSLGIDFGAAELGRYAELGLSEAQKKQALKVVRDRRPIIDGLCGRMNSALRMDEKSAETGRVKRLELEAVLEEFRQVQEEIMSGLHAIVTSEQMKTLNAIKRREAISAPKPAPKS